MRSSACFYTRKRDTTESFFAFCFSRSPISSPLSALQYYIMLKMLWSDVVVSYVEGLAHWSVTFLCWCGWQCHVAVMPKVSKTRALYSSACVYCLINVLGGHSTYTFSPLVFHTKFGKWVFHAKCRKWVFHTKGRKLVFHTSMPNKRTRTLISYTKVDFLGQVA